MVRYYPIKREDLFNVNQDNLKPHSLLAAVLSLCEEAMDKPHSEREDLEYIRNIIQDFQENSSDEEEVKSSLSDLSTRSDI
jgi:hypothetical protein